MPAEINLAAWEDLLIKPTIDGGIPIWQGATNSTSTHITLVHDATRELGFQVLGSTGVVRKHEVLRSEKNPKGTKIVQKIFVENLSPLETYRFQVVETHSGKIFDERLFQTIDLQHSDLRFALVSCANDYYQNDCEKMWLPLQERKPDLVFFIGDAVYADNKTDSFGDHNGGLENFWARYISTFERLGIYRYKKLIPTLAVWDDHDYGVNNGDSHFAEKQFTTFLFDLFWGFREIDGIQKGPGVSSSVTMQGQRFVLLDNRTFRSGASDSVQLYWGRPVEEFLYETVSRSSDPAWIFAGTQHFGGYLGSDSFEAKQEKNFKEVLGQLRLMEAPVLFGSGDVHYSEVMQIEPAVLGYVTYEITSSGIHSHSFPGQHLRGKNPRRIKATSSNNFFVIQSTATGLGQLNLDFKCIVKNGSEKIKVTGQLKRR